MGRVDPPQHSRALRADKGANGGVYIGGTSLLTVKALLVGRLVKKLQWQFHLWIKHLGGLDFSDGKGELVILLPLPQSCLRHPWAKRCVSSASLMSFWWGYQWLEAN